MASFVDVPDLPEAVVTSPSDLAACCQELARSRHFGFDTEFVGEDTYHPHLCLVQVATAEKLWLIDPLSAGPLDDFWQLVVDPQHVVVVHAGREEVRLCQLWTGHAPGNLFDLQLAAGLVGLTYPLGHAALVHQVLGTQISKGETLTEWRKRPLTRQQVRYAFDDVRFLLPLWHALRQRLEQLGRGDWARQEFERLTVNAIPEETTNEKWRKLRGLGALDRRRLAIVRALFNWREEVAHRVNRPPRTIVRDDLLVEIARRNPHGLRDLQVVRGLARRDLDAILEVVEQTHALPLEQCPTVAERDQDPPQVGLVVGLLQAVLADFCARNRLANNLVANTADVKSLVRSYLQQEELTDSLLAIGWRRDYVLPHLRAVLEGRRGVRVDNVRQAAPLAFRDEE
ncbi:MAG: ribonuclease D [Gemmataceae bacterium]